MAMRASVHNHRVYRHTQIYKNSSYCEFQIQTSPWTSKIRKVVLVRKQLAMLTHVTFRFLDTHNGSQRLWSVFFRNRTEVFSTTISLQPPHIKRCLGFLGSGRGCKAEGVYPLTFLPCTFMLPAASVPYQNKHRSVVP